MRRLGSRPSFPFAALVALVSACGVLLPRSAPAQNPGPITFAPGVDYPVNHGAEGAHLADLDGDGHLDIAATCDLNLVVLYGRGDGTFEPATYLPVGPNVYVGQLTSGDVDGDHLRDLVFARANSNTVEVLRNQGNRTFSAPTPYVVGTNPFGVHLRDLTGDGAPEMVAANNGSHNITIYYNNGSGGFTSSVTYGGGSFPARIVSGDWDRDGDVDLAMSNYTSNNVSVYLNDGTGHFTQGQGLGVGSYPAQIVTDDFNRDGKLDLATANTFDNTITVYLGNGNGTFTLLNTYPANTYPHIMASGDLDGDLYPDLAVPNNSTNYFTPFHNDGGAGFTRLSTVASDGSDLRTLAIGDVDEDGRPDVVTTEGNSLFVTVFLNQTRFPTPSAPVLNTASAVGYTEVDLSWQDTSQIESEFRIERSTDGGPFSPAGQASQNATTFSDLTVQARHAYRYRVFAVNNAGDSDPSNELEVDIPAAPPTSPDGLQVTEDTPGVVQVTWNDKSSDEDGFDLERTQLGGQAAHFYLGAGATSYQDSAVSLNRTYSYRVRAFIDATNSDYSGQVAHLTRPALREAWPRSPFLTAASISPGPIPTAPVSGHRSSAPAMVG